MSSVPFCPSGRGGPALLRSGPAPDGTLISEFFYDLPCPPRNPFPHPPASVVPYRRQMPRPQFLWMPSPFEAAPAHSMLCNRFPEFISGRYFGFSLNISYIPVSSGKNMTEIVPLQMLHQVAVVSKHIFKTVALCGH